MLEDRGRIVTGSHECTIRATGPHQVDVYVHYYPFEAPDADIRGALSKFGQIKCLRYQTFPGYPDVKTGSRIIKMVVEKEIPSLLSIQGFPCRVWYRGQPVRCNICREIGHMAVSCPNKALCRRCKEPWHTAGQRVKAWNTAQTSVPAVTRPPAAPESLPQRAPREQPSRENPVDPFEETKRLLGEAMETESVDDEFSDNEEPEPSADESNDISDYDTSEEDHLLADDVDLSFGKTRSATKRAKSAVRSRHPDNSDPKAPSVSSSAAEAPAAPAALDAPAMKAARSSASQRAKEAPKLNSLNNVGNSVNAAANEQSSSSISIENVNNIEGARNVESVKNISNVELRCNNNVDKPVSKETSISEGDSVPVDTGVSTPPSLGSFSQPSGSVSSEAPADVVASPEPSGPRKISTRKNRAARFSPMEGLAAIRQHTRTPLYSGRSSKQWICLVKLATDNGYFNCHVECWWFKGGKQTDGFHPVACLF